MRRRAYLALLMSAVGLVSVSGCAGSDQQRLHEVGESFTARSLEFVVQDTETSDRIQWIGGNFTRADGEFVIVRMRLTSLRDGSFEMALDEWLTLIDSDGNTYLVDEEMTFHQNVRLDPADPQHPILIYDVPPDPRERYLHVEETNHFVRV